MKYERKEGCAILHIAIYTISRSGPPGAPWDPQSWLGGPPGGSGTPSGEELDPKSADLGVWGLRFCFARDCFSQNPQIGSIWPDLGPFDPSLGRGPGGPLGGPPGGVLGPPLRPQTPDFGGLRVWRDPPKKGGSLRVGTPPWGVPNTLKKLRYPKPKQVENL